MAFVIKRPLWFIKLTNYEYWPIWMFYIPISFYLTYLAFKSRSLTYFTTVNPCIKDGGIYGYSKFNVLEKIPTNLKPLGILVKKGTINIELPIDIHFPIIAKPDIGERGKDVAIIQDMNQLHTYGKKLNKDFIIQEYCTLPYEAGVFYVRKPNEPRGHITSFTTKEFLTVKGNGRLNVEQLMLLDQRSAMQINRMGSQILQLIPNDGEIIVLESIGNHNKGTRFINSNHLVTQKMEDSFDVIAKSIEGFYYGRFDVKYQNFEALENGEVQIVELNGLNSEPTHIYDQNTGLLRSYRDFFRHISLMYDISIQNFKNGSPRTATLKFWKSIFYPHH